MRHIRLGLLAVSGAAIVAGSFSFTASILIPGVIDAPAGFANASEAMKPVDAALKANAEAFQPVAFTPTALKSLASDPFNPAALRLLALQARGSGDTEKSLALLRMSDRVSRRDSLTQAFLIEGLSEASGANVREVLASYNKLLLVNPSLQDSLLPALAQIVLLSDGRKALTPYIRENAPWVDRTLRLAMPVEDGPQAVVDALDLAFPEGSILVSPALSLALIDHYDNVGDNDEMRRLFERFSNGAEYLLDPGTYKHSDQSNRYGALVWRLPREAQAGFELLGSDGDEPYLRAFSIRGSIPQPARKVAFLTPGTYEIETTAEEGSYGSLPSLEVSLRCLGEGEARPITSFRISPEDGATVTASQSFELECDAQEIVLTAAPMPDRETGELIIQPLAISRISS
ncbi:hypothetical protein ACI5KX_02005 [Erythrobacter sp. GH1-10]|uniref:hypothetical protein n=1 Tax=Erythrobacter sp. GH1-10 TaxID=3349334 RepID=UPI003877ACAC